MNRPSTWTLAAIGSLSLALTVALNALAADATEQKTPSAEEIEKLINQLASENSKPQNVKTKEGLTTIFPPEYSWEKQAKVHRAAKQLAELGIAAFPELIDHLDDSRYSFSEDAQNARPIFSYHQSVGEYCKRIISEQVSRFKSWGGDPMAPRSHTIVLDFPSLRNKTVAIQWWEHGGEKSLWRLQADVLRWAIDVETKHYQEDKVEEARRAAVENTKRLNRILTAKKPLSTDDCKEPDEGK